MIIMKFWSDILRVSRVLATSIILFCGHRQDNLEVLMTVLQEVY